MITANCGGLSKVDARKDPVKGIDRARKNIEEGKGLSIGNIMKRRGGEFAFSSSNPMWRASLEILDFMPMTTVDYSGGMIISDWYTDNNKSDESIKITVRFLSNEIRSDSLKIIVHKKNCDQNQNCRITLLNGSQIGDKLRGSILRKAALLEKESKSKKKK
jgi:hypothetical protein